MRLVRVVRPHRPIGRTVVLAEILVHHAAHEVVVDRRFQCHAVKLARPKLAQRAADALGAFVGSFGARLPRIVVADIKGRTLLHSAALDGDDFVFQDGGIVVEVALENRAFGKLDQPGGDFDGAERFDLRVFPGVSGSAGWLIAGRERERREDENRF